MSAGTDAAGLESTGLLAGRLLLAAIFIHEGIAKLGNYAGAAVYSKTFGVPEMLLPLAIALELGCGLLVALGLYTRAAALLLSLFCLLTAALFHSKLGERNQLLHFEKNFAMAGGFLVLAMTGPGRLTLGRMLGQT